MSSVSGIRLFGYDGRSKQADKLDINKTYRTQANAFTPGYTVGPQALSALSAFSQQSYQLSPVQGVQAVSLAGAESSKNYGVDTFTRRHQLTAEGVQKPYQDYVNALEYSEQNQQSLLKRDNFTLYNGQMGFKVETDGQGGIDQVSLVQGSRDVRNGQAASTNLFPDRAEITQRAAALNANDVGPQSKLDVFALDRLDARLEKQLASFDPIADRRLKGPQNTLFAPVNPTAQPRVRTPQVADDVESSTLLSALKRLQPPDVDKAVVGIEAQISPQEARNVGASNAKFGVEYSDSLQDNLKLLRNRLADESLGIRPQSIVEARKGSMPVVAFMPSDAPRQNIFMTEGSPMPSMDTPANATDKKSSGGYIPFRQNGGGAQGQSSQQQSQRQPRKSLSTIA